MKVFVNEKAFHVEEGATAYAVRETVKPEADVVTLNGHMIKSDVVLQADDKMVFIKRGEIPTEDQLEAQMIARHTVGVHEKVKKATVAIAGLGGLGSNIAVALARIGVGKLILLDFDVVEPSNLNRQHYMIPHIGLAKTDALKQQLSQINPFIEVMTHRVFLNAKNVMTYMGEADIAVEAFDDAVSKAMLVETWLCNRPNHPLVAASGLAGYDSSNSIQTQRRMGKVYVVGDGVTEAKIGRGLMAPRVAVAAGHQANMVLRLIMGDIDV